MAPRLKPRGKWRSVAGMMIYKILRATEWESLVEKGQFSGSPDDLRDGFIHLSTDDQLAQTLARHFAGERGLVIAEAAVAADPLLRWEESRGGALFPHLYRPLARADIVAARVRP